ATGSARSGDGSRCDPPRLPRRARGCAARPACLARAGRRFAAARAAGIVASRPAGGEARLGMVEALMRILLMADVPRDPNSGAAGTEVQTAEALRALGHEVDEVWAPQLGRRIAHGNLHYLFELPRTYRREMKRALTAKRYDVIHVNQPHGYLAAKSKPS